MNYKWMVNMNGEKQGPYNWEQLINLAGEERLEPEALLWRKGMNSWIRTNRVKGIFNSCNVSPKKLQCPDKAAKMQPRTALSPLIIGVIAVCGLLLVGVSVLAFVSLQQGNEVQVKEPDSDGSTMPLLQNDNENTKEEHAKAVEIYNSSSSGEQPNSKTVQNDSGKTGQNADNNHESEKGSFGDSPNKNSFHTNNQNGPISFLQKYFWSTTEEKDSARKNEEAAVSEEDSLVWGMYRPLPVSE